MTKHHDPRSIGAQIRMQMPFLTPLEARVVDGMTGRSDLDRTTALRQVAEDVEAKRLVKLPPPVRDEHRVMGQAVPQAVGERDVSDKRLRRVARDAASTIQRGALPPEEAQARRDAIADGGSEE